MDNNFEFKSGTKIIYDSNSGYDIGYFIEDGDDFMYNTYKVNIITGIRCGIIHLPKHKIFKYTTELHNKLSVRYRYKL